MLFVTIYIIASVFQVYEFYLLFRCFFAEHKYSKRIEFVSYIFLFLVTTVMYFVFSIPIVTMISSYLGFLCVALLYQGTIKKKILSTTFAFVIMALAECVVAVITGYIGFDIFKSEEYYSTFAVIVLPIVQYLIVLLVRNLKNIRSGENVPVSYWIICIALPIFSTYLFLIIYSQPYVRTVDAFGSACILFMLNVFVIYLYDRQIAMFRVQREKENLELQTQYQLDQLELMQHSNRQSRAFRHDMKKHMSMIDYMIKQGEIEKTLSYLAEMQSDVALQQKYISTGNFVIDSILNYKAQEALGNDIQMNVGVNVPSDLSLSAYDINIILSNLLDNSIDAVKNMEEKEIDVRIRYKRNSLYIMVKNAYEGILQDEKGNYLTRKKDKKNHGLGLKNVDTVVKKYMGELTVMAENNIFEVEILIFI